MEFTDDEAIKYGAFTLCHSRFLENWQVLQRALRGDTRWDWKKVLARIDAALEAVYSSKPSGLDSISKTCLCPTLEGIQGMLATTSPKCAKAVGTLITSIVSKAGTWDYREHVEQCHHQGRELAQLFYRDSPWPQTQARLSSNPLGLRFEATEETEDETCHSHKLAYRMAPIARRNVYLGKNRRVAELRLRFDTGGHDGLTYLSYAFFLFHEYVSHVFGANSDSDYFDEGWMLFAAHKFIAKMNAALPADCRLESCQLRAINAHLPEKIKGRAQEYYFFAEELYYWLYKWAPGRFFDLTWELSAYPVEKNPHFCNDFVESLRYAYEDHNERDDLSGLQEKMTRYASARKLMGHL